MKKKTQHIMGKEINNVSKEVPTIVLNNDELFSNPEKSIFYPSRHQDALEESRTISGTTMDCVEVFN